MMNAFIMRVNMSVAIVAMVEAPEIDKDDIHECRYINAESTEPDASNNTDKGEYSHKVWLIL